MNKVKHWDLLLVGLLLFHLINNSLWILANNAPFPWDQAAHASLSIQIADKLRSFQFLSILQVSNYYPILIYTLGSIPLLLFGSDLKLTQFVATLLFLGTILIIYLYFELLAKNKKVAFLTALFFSLFPIVYNFSKWLMLDIPTVGFLFLTLYFWEKSKMMTNTKYTLLTFVSLALLALTKWTGLLFLLIPLLMTIWRLIHSPQKMKSLTSIIYGLIIFFLIALPWYMTNLQNFLFQSKINIIGEQNADPSNLFSLVNFTRYTSDFINSQVTMYFAIPFFIYFVFFIFKKWPHKFFVLSMLIGNYLLFTFISNKDARYTMPILPFAAFLVAYGFDRLNHAYKNIGNTLAFLLISVLVSVHLIMTIRPAIIEGTYISFYIPYIQRFDVLNINDRLVKKYDPNSWELPTILNDFADISKGQPTKIAIGIEHEHLSPATLQTALDAKKYQDNLTNITLRSPDIYYLFKSYNQTTFPSTEAIKTYLTDFDYVLLSPTNLGTTYLRNHDALLQLRYYVIHESLSFCRQYEATVAAKNTTCYVDNGEQVATVSDISIDDKAVTTGNKNVTGFANVYCPFGCSFRQLTQPEEFTYPQINIVKSYKLPDNTLVNLYKLH